MSVTKVIPVSVTKKGDSVTVSVTKPLSVTELKFSKEKMDERIKKYRELYPDSEFVPNWIAHGFNSKEEAIKAAIKQVEKSIGVTSTGLYI